VATLFPQLPRSSFAGFRSALALGAAAVVALAALRLFPLALIAAALVLPVLTWLYLRDVDVYEDEPPLVLAVTALWGAAAGVGTAVLAQALAPVGADVFARPLDDLALARVVLVPGLAALLAMAGPLTLLRYPRFNDVLDGATFGATAAVCVTSAQVIASGTAFLAAGVRPAGDAGSWLLLLATVGLAWPALMTGAVGAATAAFWQRFCALPADRRALGAMGRPEVATAIALVLVVAGAAARLYLSAWAALLAVAALAVVAFALLRRAIHLGLVEEAHERPIGPPIRCANCGANTPRHSFCIECGIALRALPKGAGAARGERGARFGLRGLVARFAGALAVFMLAGLVAVTLAKPGAARAPCPPAQPCGIPPTLERHTVALRSWRSSALGFSLQYDPESWAPGEAGARSLNLRALKGDASLLVRGAPPGPGAAARLAGQLVDDVRANAVDLTLDASPEATILAPAIAYRPGMGSSYTGTTRGATHPIRVAVLATDGPGAAVAVAAVTSETDSEKRTATLRLADSVVKAVAWPGAETPGAAAGGAPSAPSDRLHAAGPTDPRTPVDFSLVLRPRRPAALNRFLHDLDDPRAPGYRHFLSPAAFGARFGPSAPALAAVRAGLARVGLRAGPTHPQRTSLPVHGSAGAVERLLGTGLQDFVDARGARVHAPARAPRVPGALAATVSAVSGLDQRRAPRASAIPASGLLPRDAADAYGITPLHRQGIRGQGETVAILSLDSFDLSDVARFDAATGTRGPQVEKVPVKGGTPPGFSSQEVNLDIDVIRGLAPAARILDFEAPRRIATMGDVLGQIVDDGRADVVSVSWGQCESTVVPGDREQFDGELRAARGRGMNVFVASGDYGAYDCQGESLADHSLSVDWPAANPAVVAVGGTRLSLRPDGRYLKEGGWEDVLSNGGGGGGVSAREARPPWQRGPGIPAGRQRLLPDVAAAADADSGWVFAYAGKLHKAGGTSAAAPFWAASTLLVHQYARRRGHDQLGDLNPLLYRLAASPAGRPAFHDVTAGGNRGYQATTGWDRATGWGSPDVARLAREIVALLERGG
jgi:kumamolisin